MKKLLFPSSILIVMSILIAWIGWPPASDPVDTLGGDSSDPSLGSSLADLSTTDSQPSESPDVERIQLLADADENQEDSKAAGNPTWLAKGKVQHAGIGIGGARVLCFGGLFGGWSDFVDLPEPLTETVTGPDGSFEIQCPYPYVQLFVQQEGYAALDFMSLDFGKRQGMDGLKLDLFPTEICSGRVEADGIGISDATVSINIAHYYRRSRPAEVEGAYFKAALFRKLKTDALGNFSLPLPPEKFDFRAHHPKHGESKTRSIRIPSTEVVLTLNPPEKVTAKTIHGMVVDARGEPVSRCQVSMLPHGDSKPIFTNKEGNFTVENVQDYYGFDEYLVAFEQKHAPAHEVIDHKSDAFVVITLPDPNSISGRVIGVDGKRVSEGVVYLNSELNQVFHDNSSHPKRLLERCQRWESGLALDRAEVDANGEFRFDLLPPGLYELSFSLQSNLYYQSFIHQGIAKAHAGATGVVVRAGELNQPTVKFWGKVVDPIGNPLEGVQVSASLVTRTSNFRTSQSHSETFTDAEGNYRCAGVVPGEYSVEFRLKGHAGKKVETKDYAAGEYRHDMILPLKRKIVVTVLDIHGQPMPNAAIEAWDNSGRQIMLSSGMGSRRNRLRTDAAGKVTLIDMPGELVTIYASPSEEIVAEAMSVDLSGPPPHACTIQLPSQHHSDYKVLTVTLLDEESGEALFNYPQGSVEMEMRTFDQDGYPVDLVEMVWDGESLIRKDEGKDNPWSGSFTFVRIPSTGGRMEVSATGFQSKTLEFEAFSVPEKSFPRVRVSLPRK